MEPSCHRHAMPHPVTWICSMNWPIDILVPAPIDPPGTRLAPQVSLAPAKLRALKVSPGAWSQPQLATRDSWLGACGREGALEQGSCAVEIDVTHNFLAGPGLGPVRSKPEQRYKP